MHDILEMGSKGSGKDTSDSKELRDLFRAFENFKRDFRVEMKELKEGVSFCSDVCNDVKDVAEDIRTLRQEMKELLNENRKLKTENERLSKKCDELEQYQRSNNLEIKGIPPGSDALSILQKIGDSVGETVDTSDIDICHWVRTPKPTIQNILARFVRRGKRNDFLAKCRKRRLDTSMLGLRPGAAIFVNEHLTQANKALLSAAIQRKKEKQWKFVWTSGGRVLARKDESSAVVNVTCQDDIEKMC